MLETLLLLASTCAFPDDRVSTYAANQTDDGPVTVADQRAAKAHFDRIMFDGPSARWQFAYKRKFLVCGFVNGKNRLGAYTGWQPFYFDTDRKTGTIFSADEEPWMWDLLCLNIYDEQKR